MSTVRFDSKAPKEIGFTDYARDRRAAGEYCEARLEGSKEVGFTDYSRDRRAAGEYCEARLQG